MRADSLVWFGRMVAGVFGLGVMALLVLVVRILRQAEGVPPMPIALGLLGLVALILLATIALALVSIAVSLRRGVPGAAEAVVEAAPEAAAVEMAEPDMPERPRQGPPLRATRSGAPMLVARR